MVVTRTFVGRTTVAARGVPDPDSRYDYAVVLTFEGLLAVLVRRSVETAARDVLAARQSRGRDSTGAVFESSTRGDPEFAARVTRELVSALESAFEEARGRFDDEDFDRAFDDR